MATFPAVCPGWFWALGVLWSSYQAFAGWNYGLYITDTSEKPRTGRTRHFVDGLHHGILYFVCSFAGFAAWALGSSLAAQIGDWSNLSGGTATVMIALATLALLGVSGSLSRLLHMGHKIL